jgi:hypothetical protein
MTNSGEIKIDKLNRIITVRMTNEDYNALQSICEHRRSDVSKIIRTIITMVVNMVKENNRKD